MKYAIASISAVLFFYSCLLAPLPGKEKIKPAGYGKVIPGGDLRVRIEKSMESLISEIGDPENLFSSDSTGDIAFRVGDALLGLTALSGALDTDHKLAGRIYTLLPSKLNASGYLGEVLRLGADERQLAGHARLIRALCEYYRRTGESGALDMAEKICDSLFVPVSGLLADYPGTDVARVNLYFEPGSLDSDTSALTLTPVNALSPVKIGNWTLAEKYGEIFTAVDALAQLYGYRRDSGTRKVLEELLKLYDDVKDDFPGKGTSGYLSPIRGMLRYDDVQGESRFDQAARDAWDKFAENSLTQMYGSGRTTPEGFGIVCPRDASDAYIAAICLWAESGRGDYLQQAEKIYYNSVAPSQKSDGRFTCLLSDTLDGKLSRYEGDHYGGTPAWVEAMVCAVEYSYYLRDNKILLPLYGDSELVLEDKKTRIVQTTGYPLDSIIRLEVVEAPSRGIGLQLYFPSYMTARSVTRNGSEPVSGTVNSIGLLQMKEVYRKGDVIEFSYQYAPKWSEATDGQTVEGDLYKPVYGPLLLGYKNDGMLWLQRGVPLRRSGEGEFVMNPEFNYSMDTLAGKVLIDPTVGEDDYTPPELGTIYTPLEKYGREDILPEYFLVRIGKE